MLVNHQAGRSAADFAAKAAQLEATVARLDQVTEKINAATVTERSADGGVTVTVTSSGRVVGLQLDESVRELTPGGIASKVLQCVQRAQSRIADQVAAATQSVLGDHPLGQDIVADYRSRFPAVEPPPEPVRPVETGGDVDVTSMFRTHSAGVPGGE